jgi:hypothetical protein
LRLRKKFAATEKVCAYIKILHLGTDKLAPTAVYSWHLGREVGAYICMYILPFFKKPPAVVEAWRAAIDKKVCATSARALASSYICVSFVRVEVRANKTFFSLTLSRRKKIGGLEMLSSLSFSPV